MRQICRAVALFSGILFAAGACHGQHRFPTVYAETGFYGELDFKNSWLTTANAGVVVAGKRRLFLAAEGNFYRFWNTAYSSVGVGLRPALRFYPLKREKWGLFGGLKGGIIYMLPEYPYTAINFTFLADAGAQFSMTKHLSCYFAGGFMHYSNGKRKGNVLNPTWDGFGGHAGIVYRLK
ncbi:MAG: hypothetical protein JNM41_00925 [Flavipsychrobacter sp.]|nr:hypothetical protein [Flavipsychrobacter sp.]